MINYLKLIMFVLLSISISNTVFAQTTNMSTDQQIDIPKFLRVLAVSRSGLSTSTTKVGDGFCAVLAENICLGNTILIPSNSMVSGQVKKINMRKRFFNRDGFIIISINEIQTPQGQKITLTDKGIEGKISLSVY